jgi:FkbM family methyltransferase
MVSRTAYMKMAVEIVEDLDRVVEIDTGKGVIRFHCDSEIARIRAMGALEREPDTIAWIDGFSPEDIFLDIGSNVGVFTLYAAVIRGGNVIACDPLPQNHRALNQNALINGVSDKVTAICAAMNDRPEIAALMIPAIADTAGGAGATFGESYDNYQREINTSYRLNTIGVSVDDLVERFGMAVPNHIKMDIDGIQDKVMAGAANTLKNPGLKSLMLELQPVNEAHNREVYDNIMGVMSDNGFTLDKVARATPNMTVDIEKYPTNNFFIR